MCEFFNPAAEFFTQYSRKIYNKLGNTGTDFYFTVT